MELFNNVPFGDSLFQIQHFTAGQETPQRRYRHCKLQLRQKLIALKESEFRRCRWEIDLEEMQEKMQTADGYARRRLEIDIKEIQFRLDSEKQLIADCLIEVAAYQSMLDGLPKYTRKQFEDAEREYWTKRLSDDARLELKSMGAISANTLRALENIGVSVDRNAQGQMTFTEVATQKQLEK